MATLDSLKQALREDVTAMASFPKYPLSDAQYSDGFNLLLQGPGWTTYQDFILPQLSQLLDTLTKSHGTISVLEIGPGPKSILGHLPDHLRSKIGAYTAFEPNGLFVTELEDWLHSKFEKTPYKIHQFPLSPEHEFGSGILIGDDEKFDVILFCHSMYGMKPKRRFIERALEMLAEPPRDGIVVIFHRDGSLDIDGLVCHRTASFPTGVVRVADDDEVLDKFTPFVAGVCMDKAIQLGWRKICRALGRREQTHPGHLLFSAPNVMATFSRYATTIPQLEAEVPLIKGNYTVKNCEARVRRPASVVKPTQIQEIQNCVRWALKNKVGLTVVGGGHSGHCLRPNVVSVDMGAFDQLHIIHAGQGEGNSGTLVVAEAGCKTGDIIRETMAAGLTVSLGARPSVGAGLWLQGGIGHLARLHGLACDAIIGAVVVSVASGQVLCVGTVPIQHQPDGAVRPENESDLLWAIKGAGNNFGIVVSVTFETFPAPTYLIRNWVIPLTMDDHVMRTWLNDFDNLVARKLSRSCSADAYLYWDSGKVHLGVTLIESTLARLTSATPTPKFVTEILGTEVGSKVVDGVGLFDTEMYVSMMHGGHGGGKTSSFKRCIFLRNVAKGPVALILEEAVKSCPSSLCYLHLLQGGGAVRDVAADAIAFGCRDWDFACVITGVWFRDQDGTEVAQSAVEWVYNVAGELLSSCAGTYGADLGPDPRDATLATKAFGPNRQRLARLKRKLDPDNILAYACPLPKAAMGPRLVILVTGDCFVGKDYCAEIWASVFRKCAHENLKVRISSISDETKREYAASSGSDLSRLLRDRAYKEQHRPAMKRFFHEQMQKRPGLQQEHFLSVVHDAADVDVLLITGMRDDAPVATFSHLAPGSRMLEVFVQASGQTVRDRRSCNGVSGDDIWDHEYKAYGGPALDGPPDYVFVNDTVGDTAAGRFAERKLLPFFHENLRRLANMVRSVPDFPRSGMEFRHCLGIAQQPGGLNLCASLLQERFTGDWAKVDAVVSCEAGGFIFASVLASRVNIPLVLIRETGKLPPPTHSVEKPASYISSLTPRESKKKDIEVEWDAISRAKSVVVVDDVLSTGKTLCAVVNLLSQAGMEPSSMSIMVVAEFPAHRGREMLLGDSTGRKLRVQSLLVFNGA